MIDTKPTNCHNKIDSAALDPSSEADAEVALSLAQAAFEELSRENETLEARLRNAIKSADPELIRELRARREAIALDLWAAEVGVVRALIVWNEALYAMLSREYSAASEGISQAKREREALIQKANRLVAEGQIPQARHNYDQAHSTLGNAVGRHQTAEQKIHAHLATCRQDEKRLDQLLAAQSGSLARAR